MVVVVVFTAKEKLTISAPEHTSLPRFTDDHNPLQWLCLQRMPLDFSTQFLTNFKMASKDKWVIGNKRQSLQLIVIFINSRYIKSKSNEGKE